MDLKTGSLGEVPIGAGPSDRLLVGDWLVDPKGGVVSRGGASVRLEERTMRLLVELAGRPGEVVSLDELLRQVWSDVTVSPDSVYQAVASLRRALGDDAGSPSYIATVPRLGYRLIAPVRPSPARGPGRRGLVIAAGAVAALVAAVAIVPMGPRLAPARVAADPPPSVGVAPFVDMTPSMDQDRIADEMTEGLADQLSRTAALRSPGFRSSFYLIGKRTTLTEAARSLGVAYLVDGSTRRDGGSVRIVARLVEPASGRLLWSHTYMAQVGHMETAQSAITASVAATLAGRGA
jgi:DNA-binding winged helix-turn-helix (wHTH) protein/TolB-like protein